jgi:hypothetical protein
MSTSAARLAANPANAQRSTGPRTVDGKTRSSQNARTHGLTARNLVVAPDERDEFEEMLAAYQADVHPRGAIQRTLFNELIAAAWNLHRVQRMESEIWSRAGSCEALLHNPDLQTQLERLARHKSRIERTFHRNLKELRSLQTSAIIAATLPGCVLQHTTALASASEIAKRTQYFEQKDDLPLLSMCLDRLSQPPVPADQVLTHAATA